MLKKTELHEAAFKWIEVLQSGAVFRHGEVYRFLEENFAGECIERGSAPREPRYKNDARWAVQDAKRAGLVKTTKERGCFQRL